MKAEYLKFSTKGNTRRKVLREEVLKEDHNLLSFSQNLVMTEPKEGYAYEWDNTRERSQLFTQLLNEQPNDKGICYYYGDIDEWVQLGELTFIRLRVANPEKDIKFSPTMYFKVPLPLYTEWVDKYKTDLKARKNEDLPIVLKLQIKMGTVYEIKWINDWD